MLTIALLGTPQLWLDDLPLRVTRRKSRALLYYLAAHAGPLTRDHLLALFWPDYDRPAAQQVLRTTIHGLRKALGPALVANDEMLELAAEVDVRRFEALLTSPLDTNGALSEALSLYRGDFLADFTLPDTEAFDDWAMRQREHYRRLALRGFAALAHQHEARADYAAALDALDRALAFDPLQEDLQRAALRIQYLAGDRAGAIRRYERLRALLDEELGVPPMEETRALYDAIITDSLEHEQNQALHRPVPPVTILPHLRREQQWVAQPHSELPFIGRSAELAQLRALSSSHQLALIEGEPGIGKTRLVKAFLAESGIPAIVGVARELDQALPYQPVIEALRGLIASPEWPALRARLDLPDIWSAEAARLLPDLAPARQGLLRVPDTSANTTDESRLWEGLYRFLQAIAGTRQLAIVFDDLHWADSATLALLGYLIRRAESSNAGLVFIATARQAAPRSSLAALLQTLTREGRLRRIPLTRLDPAAIAALAQRLSPAYAYPLAHWLTQASEGNPYILAELVRHARENRLLLPDGTVDLQALSAAPIVPQTVYTLIQSRLARLSEPARRVLDAAVAAGREFEFDIVARAAGISEHAALDALDELRSTGLVRPLDGMRFAFDHTLTLEVAFREVGEPRHRLLHRRIAEAIEHIYRQHTDERAGLLAWHFSEGNAAERAAPYALQAAERAAALAAWREAITFYEIALAGLPRHQHTPVLRALGQLHFHAGEPARATEVLRAALAIAREIQDAPGVEAAQLALARSLLPQGRFNEALEFVRAARMAGNPNNAVSIELLWGTVLSLEGADLASAASHLAAAASLCDPGTDPEILAHITFEQGSVAAQQGDLPRAVELYRRALAIAESADDPALLAWRVLANNNLAYHLHLLGDPSAQEYAETGLQLAQEYGLLAQMTFLYSTLGELALARGELDQAEQHFNEGLAIAERLPVPERVAGITANLGLVALRRGEQALAIHRLSTALARADALGTCHLAAQIRLWIAPLLPASEARVRLAEARATAESGGRRRLLEEVVRIEQQLHT